MAVINGKLVRRATLASGVVDTIEFPSGVNLVSLALMSATGKVAYRKNGVVATVNDTDANYLDADVGVVAVNVYGGGNINKISVVSNATVDIQWEIGK